MQRVKYACTPRDNRDERINKKSDGQQRDSDPRV
jgi:hypothetical protein